MIALYVFETKYHILWFVSSDNIPLYFIDRLDPL